MCEELFHYTTGVYFMHMYLKDANYTQVKDTQIVMF